MNNSQFDNVCAMIIQHAKNEKSFTVSSMNALVTNYSKSTLSNSIARGVNIGLFIKEGGGRNTTYKLSNKLYNDVIMFEQDRDKRYKSIQEIIEHYIQSSKHKVEIESKTTVVKSQKVDPKEWSRIKEDLLYMIRYTDDLQAEVELLRDDNKRLREDNMKLRDNVKNKINDLAELVRIK